MHAQSLLFPMVTLAAIASTSPLAARGTSADSTCPQTNSKSVNFAIGPKNYLYGVYCNTKYSGGNVLYYHTANLLACAVQCDAWTDLNVGKICHAANFKPGQSSTANNCELHTNTFGGDVDILPSDDAKWESVQVTKTKVPSIS